MMLGLLFGRTARFFPDAGFQIDILAAMVSPRRAPVNVKSRIRSVACWFE